MLLLLLPLRQLQVVVEVVLQWHTVAAWLLLVARNILCVHISVCVCASSMSKWFRGGNPALGHSGLEWGVG